MANAIKIKRGTGTSTLADGELGFNTSTNTLYIGNGENKILGGRTGGRNLLACLPLSKLPFGSGDTSGSATKGTVSYDEGSESLQIINNNSNLRLWLKTMPVHPGETYVLSCWTASAEVDATRGEEYQFQYVFKDQSDKDISYGAKDSGNFQSFLHQDTLNTGWTWRVIYQIITAPANATKVCIAFRTGYDYQNYTNNFFVKNFKIEQGSVYTEWTPAPEELLTYAGGSTYESLQVGTGKSRHLNLWAGDDGVTKIGHQDANWFESNAIYLYDTHTYFKKPLQIINDLYWENSRGSGDKYGIDMQNSDIMNANGIYFKDDANAAGEGLNFARGTNTWDSLLASGGKLYFAPNRAKDSVGTRYEVYHAGGATIPISKGGTGAATVDNAILNLGLAAPGYDIPAANASEWEQKAKAYILEKIPTQGVKSFNIGWQGASFGSGIAWRSGGEVNALVLNKGATGGFKFWRHISGNWEDGVALSIAAGGTGAITAAGALTNLGALSKSGGTIDSQAFLAWADAGHFNQSGVSYPYKYGGLRWSGESDGVDLFAEETGSDNLDLVIQFKDDNSNGLQIRNSGGAPTHFFGSGGGFNTSGDIVCGAVVYANRLRLTSTTDASETQKTNVAITIGAEEGQHLIIDNNEILSKTSASTMGDLYLQGVQIQSSGSITRGTWNASTIAVERGGTGATTASGACTNIGAVKKSGDTMTGTLTVKSDGLIVANRNNSDTKDGGHMYFQSGNYYSNKTISFGAFSGGLRAYTYTNGQYVNLFSAYEEYFSAPNLSTTGYVASTGSMFANGGLYAKTTGTQAINVENTVANGGEVSIGFTVNGTLHWVLGYGCGGSAPAFSLWNNQRGTNAFSIDQSNNDAYFHGAIKVQNGNSAGAGVAIWEDGEGGNIEISSKSGEYKYQFDAHQNNYLRLIGFQNNTHISTWHFWPSSGCFATNAINIGNTGDITGIKYDSNQPTGKAGMIWLKPI